MMLNPVHQRDDLYMATKYQHHRVLIYFDVETKKDILSKIKKLLKPDGYLFLGAAETTLNLDDSFERMDFKQSGCYRLKQG